MLVLFTCLGLLASVSLAAAAPASSPAAPCDSVSPPDPRGALTLEAAVALALDHHPALAEAALHLRAARARTTDASRRPNPVVGLDLENLGIDGDDHNELNIGAEQTLEFGGKRTARSGVAAAVVDVETAEQSAERRRVTATTVERFVEAWTLQQRSRRSADAERLAERTIEAAAARHAAGAGPAVERVRAEAVHAHRQAERLRDEAELAIARRRLAAQWGSARVSFDSLALATPDSGSMPSIERLAATLATHPDRARAAADITLSAARAREAHAVRSPDLTLRAGLRHRPATDQLGFVAGASFPLPLWQRGSGETEAAMAERDAAASRECAVALRLDEELLAARDRAVATVEVYQVLATSVVPRHAEAVELMSDGYRVGRFGSLEVMGAQRDLLEAERSLIDAAADAWRARAALEQLIGMPLERVPAEESR